jgi:holo-[acyl-carrier protein] synthase
VIHGIGVDMVDIRRVARGLERYGPRFARRILSESEYRLYHGNPRQASFLAKRFAAKEALVKALGTGFRDGVSLRNITVENDDLGKPLLLYSEPLQAEFHRHGITHSHLSLADEQDYALAYVVLEAV